MNDINPYSTPKKYFLDVDMQTYGTVKFFAFTGRLDRIRYIVYFNVMPLIFMLSLFIFSLIGLLSSVLFTLIIVSSFLFFFIFLLSLIIRRVHDFNYSGWLALLVFVPFINIIFSLILLMIPGTPGANRFDNPPPPTSITMKILAFILILLMLLSMIPTFFITSSLVIY